MNNSQTERRTYWSTKMDEADEFMRAIMEYPVTECLEPMKSMVTAAQSAGVTVVFSDKPHVEGLQRLYYLRKSLIDPFISAAREMNNRGWVLKVEDAYRTENMQRGLGRMTAIVKAVWEKTIWECSETKPSIDLLLRRLGGLVAMTPKVGTHLSGSAMDISVLCRSTNTEVDRGSLYCEMSERTPMSSPFISEKAQENRREITSIMRRQGFFSYPWEFWHYNAGDAYAEFLSLSDKPARFGPVQLDLANGSVKPIQDPTKLLNSEEDIRQIVEHILKTV